MHTLKQIHESAAGTSPVLARAEAREWWYQAKRAARWSHDSSNRAGWLRQAVRCMRWALAMRDRAAGAP